MRRRKKPRPRWLRLLRGKLLNVVIPDRARKHAGYHVVRCLRAKYDTVYKQVTTVVVRAYNGTDGNAGFNGRVFKLDDRRAFIGGLCKGIVLARRILPLDDYVRLMLAYRRLANTEVAMRISRPETQGSRLGPFAFDFDDVASVQKACQDAEEAERLAQGFREKPMNGNAKKDSRPAVVVADEFDTLPLPVRPHLPELAALCRRLSTLVIERPERLSHAGPTRSTPCWHVELPDGSKLELRGHGPMNEDANAPVKATMLLVLIRDHGYAITRFNGATAVVDNELLGLVNQLFDGPREVSPVAPAQLPAVPAPAAPPVPTSASKPAPKKVKAAPKPVVTNPEICLPATKPQSSAAAVWGICDAGDDLFED